MPSTEQTTTAEPASRRHHAPVSKTTHTRLEGTLLRIHQDGYGFVQTDEGVDYYLNINSMRDRRSWAVGRRLNFVGGRARPGKATPAYDAVAAEEMEA